METSSQVQERVKLMTRTEMMERKKDVMNLSKQLRSALHFKFHQHGISPGGENKLQNQSWICDHEIVVLDYQLKKLTRS